MGCSRGVPRELRPTPWDVRSHCFRNRSPGPLGTEGPVRWPLRGSLLPAQAAGSRLRRLEHAALGWPVRFLRYCWSQRGGNPISTPSLLSLPPTRAAPLCSRRAFAGHRPEPTRVFVRRNSAPPPAAPREPGIPSATHGTPLVSLGRWGIGLHPDLGKCLHSSFPSKGPCARLFVFLEGQTVICGQGSSPFYLRGKDSPTRAPLFPSLRGPPPAPRRDGPEASEERTFPGSRFPPSRKPCVLCMSDSVALYLGNIPQFGDRQLLQGMTSEMNSKPICRGFCCGSVVGKVSV